MKAARSTPKRLIPRLVLKSRQPHLDLLQKAWLDRLTAEAKENEAAPVLMHEPTKTRVHVLGTVPFSAYGLSLVEQAVHTLKPNRMAVYYTPAQVDVYRRILMHMYPPLSVDPFLNPRVHRTLARRLEPELRGAGMPMEDMAPMLVLGLPLVSEVVVYRDYLRQIKSDLKPDNVIPIRPVSTISRGSLPLTTTSKPDATSAVRNAKQETKANPLGTTTTPLVPSKSRSLWASLGMRMDNLLSDILERELVRHHLNFDYKNRGIWVDTSAVQALNHPSLRQWAELFQNRTLAISPHEVLALDRLMKQWKRYQSYERLCTLRSSADLLTQSLAKTEGDSVLVVLPCPLVLEFEQVLKRQWKC